MAIFRVLAFAAILSAVSAISVDFGKIEKIVHKEVDWEKAATIDKIVREEISKLAAQMSQTGSSYKIQILYEEGNKNLYVGLVVDGVQIYPKEAGIFKLLPVSIATGVVSMVLLVAIFLVCHRRSQRGEVFDEGEISPSTVDSLV
ncbi:hypothetical protein L596_018633 [Steinernema carpocapsae]|uniref:Uncharacterized protein n=1 Tax=Steinernema carpocapsae TaxID=34508 RepID=A0A4U5N5Y8_STECR|nr:hypothetical protein L596_018633 [Steinernema carpocapsae]